MGCFMQVYLVQISVACRLVVEVQLSSAVPQLFLALVDLNLCTSDFISPRFTLLKVIGFGLVSSLSVIVRTGPAAKNSVISSFILS